MQVEIDGVTYVSHEDPVHRADKNFVAMVDLSRFELHGMLEQLWLREVDGGSEICCLPFYAYVLALGDVVEKDGQDFVARRIKNAGRCVLRILFTESGAKEDGRLDLREAVASVGLLSEWNGDRHVAIDVPDVSVMQPVYDSVQREISGGTAFWEWADA